MLLFPTFLTKFRIEKFYINRLNEILAGFTTEKLCSNLLQKEDAEKEKRTE